MGIKKIRILGASQILGPKKLDIFNALDIKACGTGFTNIEYRIYRNSAFVFYDEVFEYNNDRALMYYLKQYNDYDYAQVEDDGSYRYKGIFTKVFNNFSLPVRISFTYDNQFDISKLVVNYINDIKVIKYGYCPQDVVNFTMQQKLDMELENGKLESTKNLYTDPLTDNTMMEYNYRGKYYVKLPVNGRARYHDADEEFSLTGIWLQVLPIRWIVDEDSKTCVSEKALLRLRANQFINERFINKYFAKEIQQGGYINSYENDDILEIRELLDKIYEIVSETPSEIREIIIKKIDNLAKPVLDSGKDNGSVKLAIILRNILYALSSNNEGRELIKEINSVLSNRQIIDEINTSIMMIENLTSNGEGSTSMIISITNDFINIINSGYLSEKEILIVKKQVIKFLSEIPNLYNSKIIGSLDEIYKDYMGLYVNVSLLILQNTKDKENVSKITNVNEFLKKYQDEESGKLKK